jgi:hypothetical protein
LTEEETMGLFNRTRTTPAQNLPADPASTLGRDDTLPASPSIDRMAARGNAIAGKASEFYKQHPKLLGGIALVAGAALLRSMKRHP